MEPATTATFPPPPFNPATPVSYWKDLVDCGYDSQDGPFVGRFGRLSRLNIAYLFNELIKMKAKIRNDGETSQEQMNQLGLLLHQYTNALRDYQYMAQLPPLASAPAVRQRAELERVFGSLAQPSLPRRNTAASENVNIDMEDRNVPYDNEYLSLNPKPMQSLDPVRAFLRIHLPRHLSWTEEEKSSRRGDYSQGLPPDLCSRTLNRIARFLVGIVGGAWLIVPLLIMAFDSSLTKTMITVCTAVVLFALAVSLVFELDNKDTVTATATYAAVLVVFVGTSTGGS
ncbi:hypothetical protein F4781DRAFT_318043 [Annulohypoxylon bovei var. microspora]|nr:hypothetical protein F4781DRAFT_318043 [Annulohypoxylon bovei var. microspora]